jgi:xanthine dehydrogenase accessory factor
LRHKIAASDAELRRLDRATAPAGLDIWGISPDEIALSILAEIVALRRGRQRAYLMNTTRADTDRERVTWT